MVDHGAKRDVCGSGHENPGDCACRTYELSPAEMSALTQTCVRSAIRNSSLPMSKRCSGKTLRAMIVPDAGAVIVTSSTSSRLLRSRSICTLSKPMLRRSRRASSSDRTLGSAAGRRTRAADSQKLEGHTGRFAARWCNRARTQIGVADRFLRSCRSRSPGEPRHGAASTCSDRKHAVLVDLHTA